MHPGGGGLISAPPALPPHNLARYLEDASRACRIARAKTPAAAAEAGPPREANSEKEAGSIAPGCQRFGLFGFGEVRDMVAHRPQSASG